MKFEYVDVTREKAGMQRMLEHSRGRRDVPVIVENGTVTIGFDGGY